MSFWSAIVIMFFIFSIAAVISRYLEMKKSDNNSEVTALRERLDTVEHDLSERVATLERIVTDQEADLKRRIANL